MMVLNRELRELAWWLLPVVAAATVLGAEVEWSKRPAIALPAAADAPTQTVEPGLLPEFTIPGGMEGRRETVDRTLFNPTRRPAPAPAAPEAAKPKMQRGQFVLTGTTMVEGKSTAFLREVNGGKSRRVHQGESVNGLLVAEVKPDRVKLTMGDESEELVLKVIANSKPTPVPPQQAFVPPVAPGQPVPIAQGAPQVVPGAPDASVQALIERRRALRAAQQSEGNPGTAQPPTAMQPAAQPPQPVVPPTPAATGQLTFEEMYRRRFQQQ